MTNNPIERIDAVKTFLSKLVNGKPGVQVSRAGCPVFRKGLLGDYQYRRVRVLSEERFKDKPDKTHPISDIQDAGQYIALRLLYDFTDKKRIDTSKFIDLTNVGGILFNTGIFAKPAGAGAIAYVWYE